MNSEQYKSVEHIIEPTGNGRLNKWIIEFLSDVEARIIPWAHRYWLCLRMHLHKRIVCYFLSLLNDHIIIGRSCKDTAVSSVQLLLRAHVYTAKAAAEYDLWRTSALIDNSDYMILAIADRVFYEHYESGQKANKATGNEQSGERIVFLAILSVMQGGIIQRAWCD